ncbi:MAG TPA: energy transducer TonB [Bacteroidales bacterium]|nr:energy transducer TonB [Bacteroidales bacterium]HPT52733.1 energy transducer TonB [Bacteroidales bacterium]
MKKMSCLWVTSLSVALFFCSINCFAQGHCPPSCNKDEVVFERYYPENDSISKTSVRPPKYNGGVKELKKYLRENIRYPENLQSSKVEATTLVQFTVGTDGSVSEVVVAQPSGYAEFDEEAVRVVESFPNWQAASKNGEIIEMKTQVPIHFKYVTDDNSDE